jgi:putative ABC transport system permease protein
MAFLDRLRSGFSALVHRARAERDLDEELSAYLAESAAAKEAAGREPEAARAAARAEIGSREAVKDWVRDAGWESWFVAWGRDVRHAVRVWARAPGLLVAAATTLALGIGASTAIYSVVHAILIRPLPYAASDRLVRIVTEAPMPDGSLRIGGLTQLQMLRLRDEARSLSHIGFYAPASFTFAGPGEAIRVEGARLSADILRMLDAPPFIGRLFERVDEVPGSQVVVLGHALWQQALGGAADVGGRSVSIDGAAHTVVGVMPPGFAFPDGDQQLWLPFAWGPAARLVATGRLSDGATLSDARAEVARLLHVDEGRGLPGPRDLGSNPPAAVAQVTPLRDHIVGPVRTPLWMIAGAVTVLLLLACANVAGLLLARAAARTQEMAIRAALGGSRGRLIQQALVEGTVLALIAGVGGLALAAVGIDVLRTLALGLPLQGPVPMAGWPRVHEVGIDGTVLAIGTLVSVLTVAAFGVWPAVVQSRPVFRPLSAVGPTFGSGMRLRREGLSQVGAGIVVVQCALATVLLVGGLLLGRSLITLMHVDPGFEPGGVLTFQVALPPETPAADFREELIRRASRLPMVSSAAHAELLPMGTMRGMVPLRRQPEMPPGPPPPPAPGEVGRPDFPDLRVVSTEFLHTLGVRVVRGRAFDADDGPTAQQVMLVNETLARSGLLGADPIGAQVYAVGDAPWEVVGVVADVRQATLDQAPSPQVFVDARQVRRPAGLPPHFFVRADATPSVLVPALRALVNEVEPRATVTRVVSMDQVVANSVLRARLSASLLGVFAVVAVLLAVVGIYGVMDYTVARRSREIGVCMALGASPGRVLATVLGRIVALAGLGLVAGLAASVILARVLETSLFGVSPHDGPAFVVAALTLASAAAMAAVRPAVRAIRVDPVSALRCE